MADGTKIEWADATFNPWTGCTKVSAACDFCYAEAWARRSGLVQWGNHPRRRTSAANWRQPLKWQREAAAAGQRKRVFCASLADVFDNQVPPKWRDNLWALIAACPDLDWLLLTKRPQNIPDMLPIMWPWPNVWLGMTAENQEEFDRRYPHLAAVPAHYHFISYEPALGPLSIADCYPVPDWIICGGESGPGARPIHPDWARSLRDECVAAKVPFFFKQWGEWLPGQNDPHPSRSSGIAHWQDGGWGPRETRRPGENYVMWDAAGLPHRGGSRESGGYFRVQAWASRVGKRAAGRLLDGREHNEYPEPRNA